MSSLRVLLLASILALTACDLRPEDYSRVQTSAATFHARWTSRVAEVQATHDALAARIDALPPDTSGVEDAKAQLKNVGDALEDLGKNKMPAAEAEIQSRIDQHQKYLAEEALRHAAQDLDSGLTEATTSLDSQKTAVDAAEQAAAATKKTQTDALDDAKLAAVADIVAPAFSQQLGASDVLGVTFEPGTGRFEMTDDTKAGLMRIVALASACDAIRLELVAHTAKDGDPAVNDRLSVAQAEAVRQYLLGSGVAAAKIVKVSGVGGAEPATPEPDAGSDAEKAMATDQLAKIRARNRRITVKVVAPCPAANPA
jgi:outer membrane protein OmpA-like peptidoglycan-associated protein